MAGCVTGLFKMFDKGYFKKIFELFVAIKIITISKQNLPFSLDDRIGFQAVHFHSFVL